MDFIYVELKGDAPTTAMVPSNRPGITSTRLVEHAKADAIRATADSGFSEPAGTMHDYDQVIVALDDAELSLTVDGKTTTKWKRERWPSSAATSGTSRRTRAGPSTW